MVNFSNLTAADILEFEMAEEEEEARAQAIADQSAGTLNAWKALMSQPQTATGGSVGSRGPGAAALRSYAAGRDDEILSELISQQRAAILKADTDKAHLPLGDIQAWNKWFSKFPQQYVNKYSKQVREAYNNMSGELEKQRQAEHAATVTRPAAALTFKTAQTEAD